MIRIKKNIEPKTDNQSRFFNEFDAGRNLFVHGSAGTGKTYCGMYLSLESIMEEKQQRQLIICRSCVPAREQGFLPGSQFEKEAPYETPYSDISEDLFGFEGAYEHLKQEGYIKFISTSYLRGLTFNNAVIMIDEVQNMNMGEINSIITRTGDNSRLIICGDSKQNDLLFLREDSCINDLSCVISRMKSFAMVEMTTDDIVRNRVVKEWIVAMENSHSLPNFITR